VGSSLAGRHGSQFLRAANLRVTPSLVGLIEGRGMLIAIFPWPGTPVGDSNFPMNENIEQG
jgi:hypothetical protein